MTQAAYQRLNLEEKIFVHKTIKKCFAPGIPGVYEKLRKNEEILNLLADNILRGKAGIPREPEEVLLAKITPIIRTELADIFDMPKKK